MTQDIRSHRLSPGLGQKLLAGRAEIAVSELSKIERGFRMPTDTELTNLARCYGVSAEELAGAQLAYVERATPGEGYTTVRAEGTEVRKRVEEPPVDRIGVLDLFCGCGGLSHGFEQSGAFVVTAGVDLLGDRIESFRRKPIVVVFVYARDTHFIQKLRTW